MDNQSVFSNPTATPAQPAAAPFPQPIAPAGSSITVPPAQTNLTSAQSNSSPAQAAMASTPAQAASAPDPTNATPAPNPTNTAPAQNPTGTGSVIASAAHVDTSNVKLSKLHDKKTNDTVMFVGLIVAIVAAVVFIGLFIWMFARYNAVNADVEGQINQAVATAVNENSAKLEAEFLEREKEPNNTFTGPEDYGEVSFLYPKTWSVYIQSDAANGGNFQAYFSPQEVAPIMDTTPNSLRFTVTTQSFESVAKTYESYQNSGRMTMRVVTVGGSSANLYTGLLPSDLEGMVCIFKIRDKTVIFQTDSELYKDDFEKLLDTVTYNS